MNELVYLKTEEAMTDSLVVAESFGKRHDNVMAAIEKLVGSLAKNGNTHVTEGGLLKNKDTHKMFIKTWYKNAQNGERYAKYLMNRDGFSLLVMGFTGKKALEWKLKYIDAFNKMESVITEKKTAAWIDTRKHGMITRRAETDVIKMLVDYAKEQGSTHSDRLYQVYSSLANKAAGIENGGRETATTEQLNMLRLYERIALGMIRDGMTAGKHYKAIYQDTKSRFSTIQELAYLS